MNGTIDSGNYAAVFLSGVISTWEWIERFFAALWSGLGWPQAVLIMFFIVIFYFKDEIKGVIPRIKRIGAEGFEVEPPLPPIQPSAKGIELQNIPKGDFPHTFGIVLDLVKKQVEGKDQAEALQFLVGDDAGWRVLSYFENIYSYIFGGQIQLLQLLNQRGTFGLPLVEAEREWEAYKERFKPNLDELEMDTFLGFLITKELIIKTEGAIIITLTGNEFLQWMAKFGRSTNRPW